MHAFSNQVSPPPAKTKHGDLELVTNVFTVQQRRLDRRDRSGRRLLINWAEKPARYYCKAFR